ncbi:MAG: phospholipase A [Muribaculaceae bacterium]|nr:phospholipase A [Muribaculaceae bacterium]
MKRFFRRITIIVLLLAPCTASAQINTKFLGKEQEKFNVDSIITYFDNLPFFSIYKDNYFALGTALNHKPTEYNSDVKFQISFRQRLTKSILPFHSYLFLSYSQKAMWNIFEESLPFHDLNFNPGIGVQAPIIAKGKIVGNALIMVEHESNGRDGEASRSWNKVSFAGSAIINSQLMLHAKTWIPIIDGQQNKDILKYSGIFQTGAQFISKNKRWVADVTFVKRQGWNMNFNTIVNVGFRIRKKDNQFLMLHFYDGYGENMLDYNKYHCRLRLGLLIRPAFFSDF